MAAITYTYDNGQISHFVLKKVDSDCFRDNSHTVSIGIFCKMCPFYYGMKRDEEGHTFVVCTSNFHKQDDEGARELRYKLWNEIEENALRIFYD